MEGADNIKTKLPRGQTLRSFKSQKRKEFMEAKTAMENLSFGCAYLPKDAFEALQQSLSLFETSYKICRTWWKNE